MRPFDRISEALIYIDAHLGEELTVERIAGEFHFSPFYFHRMFTLITGEGIAAYIRGRRLERARRMMVETQLSLTEIALECGMGALPAFSRAFRREYGLSPNEYRRMGCVPQPEESVDEIIVRFTNRIRGGVYVNPNMIKRGRMYIAGVSGPGDKTAEVWRDYEALEARVPPGGRIDENGYEVRMFDGVIDRVHVGCAMSSPAAPEGYEIIELPAGEYASFDVYVAQGYESENSAMNEWLGQNRDRYAERRLNGAHFVVEYYDERFNGEESGSIVEIWLPVERADS